MVIEIKDEIEFQNKIKNELFLIVLIYHNWSGYSNLVKKVIEDWQNLTNRKIYFIDASEMNIKDYLYKWVESQEEENWNEIGVMKLNKYKPRNRIHGYGETLWINEGNVVGFESVYQSFNSQELEKRTIELLQKEN